MRGAEAGDAVDDEQRLGCDFLDQLGDRFDVVADAGRGLGGLHVDGFVLRLERGADFVELEGLAVGRFDHVGRAAEGLGQIDPALAEFAGGEHQHLVAGRGEVGDRGLHGAGAGGGEQQDVVLGADKDLELGQHLLVEGAELGGAVVHVGGRHGELGGRKQRGWSGGIKARLADHGFLVFRI